MTYDAGRIRHDGSLMHYSRASNGSSVPSNWRLSATGDTGVVWSPESASAVSYGSNATSVGTANAGGASSDASRSDHVHLGVRGISSNGSNTLVGDVNLAAGSGIALGVSGQSISIVNTGQGGGGGGSVSYGSNSNEVSYANAAGASSLVSRSDHVHLGVTSVSHSSNTFSGPVILTASGTAGITVPTPGTLNFSAFGTTGSGGGGSSGALVLLEQHTASSSSSLDFTTWYSSTYDEYLVEILAFTPATNAAAPLLRFSTNGGSSYDTSSIYDWANQVVPLAGGGSTNGQGGVDGISLFSDSSRGGLQNTAIPGMVCTFRIFDPAHTSNYKYVQMAGLATYNNGTRYTYIGGGVYRSTTAVDAFRVIMTSGNITAGTIRVYGIAK